MRNEAEKMVDEMVEQFAQVAVDADDDAVFAALIDAARKRLDEHWRNLHELMDRRAGS